MGRLTSSSSGGNVTIVQGSNTATVNDDGSLEVSVSGFSTLSAGSPGQIDVGSVSTQLLAANPNRRYAHISNNSGHTVFIQYSASAVLNQGIKLPPNTVYTIEFNNLWLGSVNAIGALSSQLIDVLEGE